MVRLQYDIDAMIMELEERIPALFSGTICPNQKIKCECTFKTGCMALTRVSKQVTIKE
jgi:hypothetical protein